MTVFELRPVVRPAGGRPLRFEIAVAGEVREVTAAQVVRAHLRVHGTVPPLPRLGIARPPADILLRLWRHAIPVAAPPPDQRPSRLEPVTAPVQRRSTSP